MNACVDTGNLGGQVLVCGSSQKYWYDILMGFKTELLVAYGLTLLFAIIFYLITSIKPK